jgi:tetratricopeptide (TPR) repeat protein
MSSAARANAGAEDSGPCGIKPLEAGLVQLGAVFMAAAIVGGAVQGAGVSLPVIDSLPRELLLGGLGAVLTVAGTATRWGPFLHAGARSLTAPRAADPGVARPPDPSPVFVGRRAELERLQRTLASSCRAAITGMAGVGKTQLAVQYLHSHRSSYPGGIFWLSGEEPAVLSGNLALLASLMDLPEREDHDQRRRIRAVVRWLQEHDGWLAVIDNVGEAARSTLGSLFPPGLLGHLLVTSRHPVWSALQTGLDSLPLEEATHFLLMRTGLADDVAAEQLSLRLGGLPLALEQAAAYLLETGESLSGYLDLLAQDPAWLLAQVHLEDGHEPVTRTWDLSLRRLERSSPAAVDLLRLCAFLAPDDIPLDLLQCTIPELEPGSRLPTALADAAQANQDIAVLLGYSLTKRRGQFLNVHRLLQDVIRLSLPRALRQRWASVAIHLVHAAYPDGWRYDNWSRCQLLLPHAIDAARHAMDLDVEPLVTAAVLSAAGTYLHATRQTRAARALAEDALAIHEQLLGRDHPDAARSLNNLALLLQAEGELAAALPLFERVLATREQDVGPDHPDTARSLSNLGLLLQDQGELAAAQPLFERALAIRKQALGPDHPGTAQGLNHLGRLLQAQGKLATAQPLLERALAIRERALGPDHPDTARSLNNLGRLLQDQG